MATETLEALVDAGEASAGPPLGPKLGPMGVDIMEIVNAINEETEKFKGMQVPIKLTVDTESGDFDIEVGTPPTSGLILEKVGIEKGSGEPNTNKVADLKVEEAKEIAEMKDTDLLGKNLKQKTKEVIGSCVSMGITVDDKEPREAQKLIDEGEYDSVFE
ncbi:MAG: 50S ribosomal protein L11 [Candidatus Thermoplasmatota archaeon]|nr:50S ribosomal protein L11 [Candidatus Thermoplasmatota archaeon]MBS3790734.1 50S ribosomal protein L11 [Candidatus Thermoplasmatota archaeon]